MSNQNGNQPAEKTLGLRDRKKAETRERIAQATVEILVNEGAENATTARIAEKAHISARTFHNYFPHREAALLFILNQFVDEMVNIVEVARPGQPLISIAENIAVNLYNRPSENPRSIDTLSRLADHLRSIPPHQREELFAEDQRHFSSGVEFFSPLVEAFQQYSKRAGNTLSTVNALLLINTMMFIPGIFVELNKTGDVTTEQDIRNVFQLLANGLSELR
ncbi:TetR/AcrR family transcriptional regulator [uncultured Corynebacterium sp.]|uniref:TetR/AcrR family transcriptional regulator n=1 Tax=uncultured Corynebacterium sp. TaxID=159447 RepID=UPI0025EE4A85|nr:TetR/AcrR family transcriptional regulator [uncultured Corynebacterium sp.]